MPRIRNVLIPLAAVVTVVALLVWMWGGDDSDPGTGTDADMHLAEPASEATTAAESAMVCLYTWEPAEQSSPWDAMHGCASQLTGRLASSAKVRPTPDPKPTQWQAWAESGDRVVGTGERTPDQPGLEGGGDDLTSVRVKVGQVVMHPSGDTTPRESLVAKVRMVREGDVWKAEYFEFDPGT